MATVYIHIGAPKTATSTLQAILSKNDGKLLKQGVLYPRSCRNASAHHPLICDLIDQYQGHPMPDMWYGSVQRGESWSELAAEIALHGQAVQSVVISSELFFGQARFLESMLHDVLGYLEGHRVKVVAYLRRQDQMYGSFYNQDVKGSRQWSHNAYRFYETHQIFQRDYYSLLSAWGDALGKENVLIRPFDPAQWLNGDIVQDFCHLTGLPALKSGNLESNESLGPNQLYIKRCLNRMGFEKGLNDEVLALLAKFCPESPASSYLYVHKRLYRKYRRDWLRTNNKLSGEFLPAGELFQQPVPEAQELAPYKLDDPVLVKYLESMTAFFSRGRKPEFRQLFARAAMLVIAERSLWAEVDPRIRDSLSGWV